MAASDVEKKSTWNLSFTIFFPSSSSRSSDPTFYIPSSSSRSSDLTFFFVQIWRSNRSSSILCSSSVHRSSSSLFFVRLFFLFFFRSAFNCPIGALAFFILRSSSIHRSSSLFLFFATVLVLRQIVLQVPKSSLRDSILLFRIESIRLEICLASYFQLTKWELSL